MNFRASFCDPFKPDIIEMGDIEKDKIMKTFEKIPWTDLLNKMETAHENDIYYSPSLEIENKDNKTGSQFLLWTGKNGTFFSKDLRWLRSFSALVRKWTITI